MSLGVKKNEVKQITEALKKLTKTSDELLDEVADINLQFTVKKIPKLTNKTIKIKLPHGLHKKNTEVCLFVKDVDKKSREHELTSDHFKDLLKSKGVTCISEIIPLKSLKLEYKPYEAKRNLSQNFDLYLADSRIVRLLPSLLGKSFYGRKRQPVQVNLKANDLKKEITNAVNNTRCIITGRGPVSMVRVAHFDLKTTQIVENVMSALEQLVSAIPGGAVNIRNVYLKTKDSMALPLYVSMGSNEEVNLPVTKKTKKELVVDEITTVEDGKVEITPTGFVKVVKEGQTSSKMTFKRRRTGKKGPKSQKKKMKLNKAKKT
ncbi:ribosomal L1 domain-containing protein 1-like [Mytilus californianus]|uniref:ribosomal L1 domain-containing protein 1-like n=1 Tax=Mytilus californianus TaxID=6549 RepID=UPI002245196E|nr:ribosomal L1 domain-containing protein 1-like [Mytilus californianus]